MPWAPYSGWATLAFLALVVVLMGFSDGAEKIAFYSIPVLVVVLAVGWRVISKRRESTPVE
jgi:L-asparagine permease